MLSNSNDYNVFRIRVFRGGKHKRTFLTVKNEAVPFGWIDLRVVLISFVLSTPFLCILRYQSRVLFESSTEFASLLPVSAVHVVFGLEDVVELLLR